MTNKTRSTRLELHNLPRDKARCLGGLRQALCASFNYCRQYPAKLAVLKETLKVVYNAIVALEKANSEALEAKIEAAKEEAKQALEEADKQAKIDAEAAEQASAAKKAREAEALRVAALDEEVASLKKQLESKEVVKPTVTTPVKETVKATTKATTKTETKETK